METAAKYAIREGIFTNKELVDFLNRYPIERVNELREKLAGQSYYCNNVVALKVLMSYDLRTNSLILSGDPGAGKTSLFTALTKIYQKPYYRLDCYKNMTEKQALYSYNIELQTIRLKLLFDQNPHASAEQINNIYNDIGNVQWGPLGKAYVDDVEDCFILINEIDKVPPEDGFEALLLTYIDEYAFIVKELNKTIHPKTKRNPWIIITSNAGSKHGGSAMDKSGGGVKVLSYPLQRRGTHLYLHSPNMARIYQIIISKCPKLDRKVARQIVLYVARQGFVRRSNDSSTRDLPIRLANSKPEKPIGTSEIIDWAKGLEWLYQQYVGRLDQSILIPEFVALTIERLAKTDSDQNTMMAGLTDDIRQVYECQWNAEVELAELIKEDQGVEIKDEK